MTEQVEDRDGVLYRDYLIMVKVLYRRDRRNYGFTIKILGRSDKGRTFSSNYSFATHAEAVDAAVSLGRRIIDGGLRSKKRGGQH